MLGVIGFLVCWLLLLFFPEVPRSVLGWMVLIFVGIPVLLLLELIGTAVLGAKFFSQLPSFARVLVAVPAAALLAGVALFLVQLVQHLMLSV